jgi:phage repressor protein C with HTH and peptisase S24 domain
VSATPLAHPPLRSLLAAELLREGRTVELPATGTSMRPLFAPGDRIRVRPASAADVRPGDVVVIVDDNDALVAHRLIYATGAAVHLRGDDSPADPPYPPDAVVGVAEVDPSPRALYAAVRALLR